MKYKLCDTRSIIIKKFIFNLFIFVRYYILFFNKILRKMLETFKVCTELQGWSS